jgi:hypothetical protein
VRGIRQTIYERDGVRISCGCLCMTKPSRATAISGAFREMGYAQTPDHVAKTILGIRPQQTRTANQCMLKIVGSEFEDTLFNTMPQWVEAKHTEVLGRNCKCQEKLFGEYKVDVDSSLSRAPFQGQSSKYMNNGRYILLHNSFQRCMHRKDLRWY